MDIYLKKGIFFRRNKNYNYYVREVINAIKSRYMERLSLPELAAQMHVSESYLLHKFKEETNCTFLDYLNQYRVMKSIELLRQRRHA